MTTGSHGKFFCFLPVIAACLILSPFLSGNDVYKARMLTGKAPVEPPAVNVRIEIESYTTSEEVQLLQESMNQGGTQALLNSFQGMKKGVVRIMSQRGWNMPVHAAFVIHREKGIQVRCFLLRQAWDPGSQMGRTGANFFMVVELNLDEKGKGEGRFYEDAGININPMAGTIEMTQYGSAPKVLVQASLVKPKEEKPK